MAKRELSSGGHRLGQIVGDWWEQYVLLPLLQEASQELNLFCDNRFVSRTCRGEKIQWEDEEGNFVDYDFVIEHGGSASQLGTPVAFIECFWRRGARHSKDKARDDTNKLLPMRHTYPTARFLSISACGEFTEPAKDYVRSRSVDLFFIAKPHIVSAFLQQGVVIDYPDNLPEADKLKLAQDADNVLSGDIYKAITTSLRAVSGEHNFSGYKDRIVGSLRASPQLIKVHEHQMSDPKEFLTLDEVTSFLNEPEFSYTSTDAVYTYHVSFSDGSEFTTDYKDIGYVKRVHQQLVSYDCHLQRLEKV